MYNPELDEQFCVIANELFALLLQGTEEPGDIRGYAPILVQLGMELVFNHPEWARAIIDNSGEELLGLAVTGKFVNAVPITLEN